MRTGGAIFYVGGQRGVMYMEADVAGEPGEIKRRGEMQMTKEIEEMRRCRSTETRNDQMLIRRGYVDRQASTNLLMRDDTDNLTRQPWHIGNSVPFPGRNAASRAWARLAWPVP